ncbi:vWFA domain-containing protein [Histomonas meleagridis]|uniref:vWFA domain-containing protein n=1 Tax=Histomonas meleagridis TaxID=135588 RepID=UPI00355A3F41|nr:vWFA domain-containing protein [Histomonas meleagridis]KAH0800993.1 vWFA domain-containing protein [Histomonas meleagridis]
MNLKIVIYGNVSEATDFAAAFESKQIKTFLNTNPNEPIDVLIVFNQIDNAITPLITDKTIIFSFDSSLTFKTGEIHFCKLTDSMTITLQEEIPNISKEFHRAFGILSLVGIKIIFSKDTSCTFSALFAASTTHDKSKDETPKEKVILIDPKTTTFHLIIALDCTGSMSSEITNIKDNLISIVNTIKREYKRILISFYGFRDYCDPKVINKTIFKDNPQTIIQAIQKECATGGGDGPEAHKTCLYEIYSDIVSYRKPLTSICIFISDDKPHIQGTSWTNEYKQEKKALEGTFASDWVSLAQNLNSIGCQIFSFSPNSYNIKPMTIMSKITHGLCFTIPKNSQQFRQQILSIIGGLISSGDFDIVQGIEMIVTSNDIEDETEINKIVTDNVKEKDDIKSHIIETGKLMRLDPSSRGAKRAVISSAELFVNGKITIKALKSLYKLCQGNQAAIDYFLNNEFGYLKKIGESLKNDSPSLDWLTSSTISCICSSETYCDSFEELMEFDEEDITNDIIQIFKIIGKFVIGYPFLFELNPDGDFNMQDAWPIHLKDVSTAYTLSIESLYSILEHSESHTEISQFKDLIARDQKSGIVPIVYPNDKLGMYIIKILDATKWLDSLISYGLHRHIEPLPSITRSVCCNFIITLCFNSFKQNSKELSISQKSAINNILLMMESMVSIGCREIAESFKTSFKNFEIPYDALSPQAPYNCSTINKLLNVIIQLKNEIKELDIEYVQLLFKQIIYEYIAMRAIFLDENAFPDLLNKIFDDVKVDINDVENQNPLESSNPEKLNKIGIHIYTDHINIQFPLYLISTIFKFIRPDDEFIPPTDMELTAAFAQSLIMYPRSTKYIASEKTSELNPKFKLIDARKSLLILLQLYAKKVKIEELLTLQENRRQYLTNEIIKMIINSFRNCDIESLFNALHNGYKLYWMRNSYKLEMKDCQKIFDGILDQVKKPLPNSQTFYEKTFYLLSLGEVDEMVWEKLTSFRNLETIMQYLERFLPDNDEILEKYKEKCARPLPNRHSHHPFYCPFQDYYTPEYARSRIICSIAPFYFVSDLPHHVNPINDVVIHALSLKSGAPKRDEIYKLALEISDEMEKIIENEKK